jgi:hypothetical protein
MESLNLAINSQPSNSKPAKAQGQHLIRDEDDDFHDSDGEEGSASESEEDHLFHDEDERMDSNATEEEAEVDEKENRVTKDHVL